MRIELLRKIVETSILLRSTILWDVRIDHYRLSRGPWQGHRYSTCNVWASVNRLFAHDVVVVCADSEMQASVRAPNICLADDLNRVWNNKISNMPHCVRFNRFVLEHDQNRKHCCTTPKIATGVGQAPCITAVPADT